jgi:hypothetical protein
VPSPADNSPANRQGFWPPIIRIAIMEILVLLALSAAFVGYLNWSSEVTFADFLAASKLAAPAPHSSLQPVKGHALCDRSA